MVEVSAFLGQYLLNPYGILGLLGLVPLIIFYFIKPEPDRKVMPSIEFFREEEKESPLHRAFNELRSNLILLLNILAILLLSLAVAEPFVEREGGENTVVIYDKSASMMEKHSDAVAEVLDNSGTDVTLVSVSETVHVEEDLNRQEAADYVRDNPPDYLRSDMSAALSEARQHEGDILLLSNLDVSDSLKNDYQELASERGLRQIDFSTENSWGFVDYSEEHVEVRNYEQRRVFLDLGVNGGTKEIEIGPEETKRVGVELDEGENTLELPRDDFMVDNTLHLYNPEEEPVQVEYIGPDNSYLTAALEVIDTVEVSTEGDLLIIDEDSQEALEDDRSKILMQGTSNNWDASQKNEENVAFDQLGLSINTEIYNLNSTEESLSSPEEAVFKSDNTIYYNIRDDDLRTEIEYPILWRDMIHELESPENFESQNSRIRFSDFSEPGFFGSQAAQFIDEQQFDLTYNNVEQSADTRGLEFSQTPALITLIMILVSVETLIVLSRGTYQ